MKAMSEKNAPLDDRAVGGESDTMAVVEGPAVAIQISTDLGVQPPHFAVGMESVAEKNASFDDGAVGLYRLGPSALQLDPRNLHLLEESILDKSAAPKTDRKRHNDEVEVQFAGNFSPLDIYTAWIDLFLCLVVHAKPANQIGANFALPAPTRVPLALLCLARVVGRVLRIGARATNSDLALSRLGQEPPLGCGKPALTRKVSTRQRFQASSFFLRLGLRHTCPQRLHEVIP